ncbi:MAG: hypothetical protein MUO21_07725 [Nitrososphaeraceae archaeon]|nr:hypothetical protein [Nitrososphaeraceae archaeon]
MNPIWPILTVLFSLRYGLFGNKTITLPKNERAFVVKDPFCDYLMIPNAKNHYRWSIRPINLKFD